MIKHIIRNRILQHLVFWALALYLLLKNFQTSSVLVPVDLIYTMIYGVFLAIAVYINLLVLIPSFFHKGKYIIYGISLAIFLAFITYLFRIWFDVIVDKLFGGFYLISYFDYWDTMKYFVILIGISSLLHFSKSWFLYKESETKLAQTQKEKIEAELDALKSQINPHFLFNSLSSIYSLVLKKSDKAPEALIKLSDTMRYIIYESNHEKVELKKEIEFIGNYIELQKLRISDKDKLEYRVNGKLKKQKIAPLLLIPIIENGFKYGIKGETEASFISIHIEIGAHQLQLITSNNLGTVDQVEKVKSKGTGLENLKKRLELIYPGLHELIIDPTGDKFTVNLKIDL